MKSAHGPSSPKGDMRATIRAGNACISASAPSPNPASSPRGVDSSSTSAVATSDRNRSRSLALAQVEHDRALAAVVLPEEQRALGILAVLIEGPDPTGGIATRRLHLDHVGAQSRQCQPAVLSLFVGQLDDPDAGEGTPAVAGNGARVLGVHAGESYPVRAAACRTRCSCGVTRARLHRRWKRFTLRAFCFFETPRANC